MSPILLLSFLHQLFADGKHTLIGAVFLGEALALDSSAVVDVHCEKAVNVRTASRKATGRRRNVGDAVLITFLVIYL